MAKTYRPVRGGTFAPPRVEDLEAYVAAERAKGRTWGQIARATAKAEADLKKAYGGKYP